MILRILALIQRHTLTERDETNGSIELPLLKLFSWPLAVTILKKHTIYLFVAKGIELVWLS